MLGVTALTSAPATIKACADHDAGFVGANLLYLKGGTKDHFMGFLRHDHPAMAQAYRRLYPGAYAPAEYAGAVRAIIETLKERYAVAGLRRRGESRITAPRFGGADDELPLFHDSRE